MTIGDEVSSSSRSETSSSTDIDGVPLQDESELNEGSDDAGEDNYRNQLIQHLAHLTNHSEILEFNDELTKPFETTLSQVNVGESFNFQDFQDDLQGQRDNRLQVACELLKEQIRNINIRHQAETAAALQMYEGHVTLAKSYFCEELTSAIKRWGEEQKKLTFITTQAEDDGVTIQVEYDGSEEQEQDL